MSQAQPPSTVVYEPGRFLLPATTFFAFLELAEDPQARVAPEERTSLESAGVLVGGHVARDLRPIARAVDEARCEIMLDLDQARLSGWVSPELVVLLAPEDQRVDVMAGPTTHLPLLLPQLAGLAPRGDVHLGAAIEIAEEGLPGLLATDPRLLEIAVDGHGIDDARTAAALSRRVETYRAAGL